MPRGEQHYMLGEGKSHISIVRRSLGVGSGGNVSEALEV